MEVTAKLGNIRIAPRKVRLVADVVRGMPAVDAIDQLKFTEKRAASHLIKLINSAIANATNNFQLDADSLIIKEIMVNEGPTLKRFRPVSRGRGHDLLKRSSQVKVALEGKKVVGAKIDANKKADKPEVQKLSEAAKEASLTAAPQDKKDSKTGYFQKGGHSGADGNVQKTGKKSSDKMFRRKSVGE